MSKVLRGATEGARPRARLALIKIRDFIASRKTLVKRFRVPLLLAALVLLALGATWSFATLGIRLSELRVIPMIVLSALVVPSLIYGGIGLWLLSRSAGLALPLSNATTIAAYAYLAELLPLPGGAIVRTGALMRAGGGLRDSSLLVLLTAVLWISLAILGAGIALSELTPLAAASLIIVGGVGSCAVFAWLWITAGLLIASVTVLHRVVGILLIAVRLVFAFAAFGITINLVQTIPFVLTILIGSAAAIFPAGLGVSESLAAMVAHFSHWPAGVAFLAVAMDRLVCVVGCSAVTLARQALRPTIASHDVPPAIALKGL